MKKLSLLLDFYVSYETFIDDPLLLSPLSENWLQNEVIRTKRNTDKSSDEITPGTA